MSDLRETHGNPGGNLSSSRVPPYNLEAEQSVLASILLNNDLMSNVLELLRPDDFYQGSHRTLFTVMLDLSENGQAIDQLTLSAALSDKGIEKQVGGLSYISELLQSVPTTANLNEYARIVKEKAILRQAIAVAQEITASAYQGVSNVNDFLDQTEQAVFAIAENRIRPSYHSMAEMAKETMKIIEDLYEKKQMITGVPSGFRDLDGITSGFQPSNLIVVAARPGMGKTALCLNIAQNVALQSRIPVAIFSLEMGRQELALRMICSDAHVEATKLRRGFVSQNEFVHVVKSVSKLSQAPIYIDDSGGLSSLELRAKARRLKKDKKIGMLIIDYLQLMSGSGRGNSDNRVQEISDISRGLKSLAKELEIPVIALSQLNRGLEGRTDKRPQLSDLRESGAIEQDADIVLFIHREEMYLKAETPDDKKGTAEIIIGKHRNGPTDTVPLTWLGKYTKFENRATDDFQ
ncbi:MAG TPA: replicative DNA helicase [Candidatus Deferrimicrobiaceae bacterium]|jgi:replicative DNA helicase